METNSQKSYPPIPADDPNRILESHGPMRIKVFPMLGLVGDTYTVLLSGKDTADRFCLIDM
jgi:hypothetical protein